MRLAKKIYPDVCWYCPRCGVAQKSSLRWLQSQHVASAKRWICNHCGGLFDCPVDEQGNRLLCKRGHHMISDNVKIGAKDHRRRCAVCIRDNRARRRLDGRK